MIIRQKSGQLSLSQFVLVLMAVFYIALPSYFAFELSAALPSFSASRVILIVATLCSLFERKKIRISSRSSIFVAAILWSFGMIALNAYHLIDSFSYSSKEIFSIFLEKLLLILIICTYVDTREKIDRFLHYMVVTSLVLSVIGIVEFISGFNFFELLETTSRFYLQSSYERAGMHRTASSFGHAVYYALYCNCILPFSLYLYEKYHKRLYLACALFNVVGVLTSGTRGQILPLTIVILVYIAFADRSVRNRYIQAYLIISFAILVVCLAVPMIRNYLVQNTLSLMRELGFDVALSEGYGVNAEGARSRIVQFSGVRWLLLNDSFLLGFGPVPAFRGLVAYYYPNSGWVRTASIDVGYMSWFLSFGLVGFLMNCALFLTLLNVTYHNSKKSEHRTDSIEFAFLIFVITYLISLLNSSGNGELLWIIIALMIVHQRSFSKRDIPEVGMPKERAPKKVRVKIRRK